MQSLFGNIWFDKNEICSYLFEMSQLLPLFLWLGEVDFCGKNLSL